MTEEQKSIVVDVKQPQGERWFALEFDKKLRRCTQNCLSSALKQGIQKGDEVLYTVNGSDMFSYLKKTGKHFDVKELPKPAGEYIDADKEQAKHPEPTETPVKEKTDWERKFEAEQKKNDIIMWEALLNTATEIVLYGSERMNDVDENEDIRDAIEKQAEREHRFIMEKVTPK